jgi:hypothetical protein
MAATTRRPRRLPLLTTTLALGERRLTADRRQFGIFGRRQAPKTGSLDRIFKKIEKKILIKKIFFKKF